MSSITSPVFTGVSSYATDLQNVITRAVGIASLPLTQLQNQLQDMNGQSTALSGLDTVFTALQTSIGKFDYAVGAGSLSGVSSNPAAVSASISAGALQGDYTIDVSTVGSATTTISDPSLPAVADPYNSSISSSSNFTLTVNGRTFSIAPGSNTLMSLAQALNSASAGVQASIINTGSTKSPQYQLVIRSSSLGPDTIQLNDGSRDLLNNLNTGSTASYTVNGSSTPIQSTSRAVTLGPGVTATLLQATGQPVTVSVSQNMDAAKTAVQNFVTAYNAAVDALDQHVGTQGGQLSGKSIVRDLYNTLRQITQYDGTSGGVRSLAAVGVNLDNQGKLQFNQTTFDSANIDDVTNFLGTTSGGGFLKAANDALTGAEDPVSGSLQTAIQQVKDGITNQTNLIAENQQRIDDLQANLQQRMAAADALLASMESQKSYLTNLFTAMINNNNNNSNGVKSS
jgi:flagellar hook-associated protein 2